jgi:putative ABC transport system permease protein
MPSLLLFLAKEARWSLWENKARSVLPMLGIVWGIANVVVFLALSEGVERGILSALGEFGTDVVLLQPGITSATFRGHLPGRPIHLRPEDGDAIRQRSPLVTSLSLEAAARKAFQHGARNVSAVVCGVEPEYGALRSMQMAAGRFLSAEDLRERRPVAVLGNELAGRLFRNRPPVGSDIRIDGMRFTVIGVLKQKTAASRFGGPDNQKGFIPITTASKLMETRDLSAILLQPVSIQKHAAAIREARSILAERHHFAPADRDAVAVWDFLETVKKLQNMISGIQAVNALVGLLTLTVGGVGVMNVLLVSVGERTVEIGLRKAVGARKHHIALQFFTEALIVTLPAGGAGMCAGAVVCRALPPIPIFVGQAQLQPDSSVMILAFAILVLVGLASGTAPAFRAMRLSPIEALRCE